MLVNLNQQNKSLIKNLIYMICNCKFYKLRKNIERKLSYIVL